MKQHHSTRLRGKTLRWTFDDGPVAGKTFEHRFADDGAIEWRSVGGASPGKPSREQDCASADLDDRISVVSYRAASGYTLTVVLDFNGMKMIGFGSNSDMWSQQSGHFEVVG
jgi:hypothetical protein